MAGPLTRDAAFERVLDVTAVAPSARRAKRLLLQNLTLGKIACTWDAFTRHLQAQLKAQKDISVASLGKFGHNRADRGRLVLALCDNFVRSYKVQVVKRPMEFGTTLDVNYTQLSLETRIPKEEVRAILMEVIAVIGQAILACKQPLMIDFGELGTLYADHRRVHFAFGERHGKGRDESGNAAFAKHAPDSARDLNLVGFNAFDGGGRPAGAGIPATILEEDGADAGAEHWAARYAGSTPRAQRDGGSGRSAGSVPPLNLGSTRGESVLSRSAAAAMNGGSPVASSRSAGGKARADGVPVVYPGYLDRQPSEPLRAYCAVEDRVEQRVERLGANMEKAFERCEAEIAEHLKLVQEQERDIAKRNEMSEMAYREKQLRSKQEMLDTNAFLMEQSRERRERERQEREAMRTRDGTELVPGRSNPFPLEQDPDVEGAERAKSRLKVALQKQMRDKERRTRDERAKSVAEERFLMDCNTKLMQADRRNRQRKKEDERKTLQEHWNRQQKLAKMQKLLTEAKNGKILTHVQSEDGLLTVRSIASTLR